MEYAIYPAERSDAEFIARAVMDAVGEELCVSLAGGEENLPKVRALFTRLGASERAQYSYRNTFVAKLPDGTPIGAIVVYDGARLRELRGEFISAANEILGWSLTDEEMSRRGDETGPYEVYIDSLFVVPEFRGKGVAVALIRQAIERKRIGNKPFGLLVEPENAVAKRLYESLGFRQVGISHFFSVPMLHMELRSQASGVMPIVEIIPR